MVIKGGARSGAAGLSAHLQRLDTNERAEVRELRGVAAQDLDGALREIEAVATGARSHRHFYHASINTRADEVMTPEQWKMAVDRLEKGLGLDGQPRAVVFHLKEGRAHVHAVWSRIDLDKMAAISDGHNFRRHEIVARELEREFGHARVQGVHVERDAHPRPDRSPSHSEMQQAERNGVTPEAATGELTALWQQTDSGKTFASALAEQGWCLARGDRRDFIAVDSQGGIHSLSRRIEGVAAKDIRARMSDIDGASLSTVAEARESQRARRQAQAERKSQTQELPAPAEPQPLPEDNDVNTLARADAAEQKVLRADADAALTEPERYAAQDLRQERREEIFDQKKMAWRGHVVDYDPHQTQPVKKGLDVIDAATGAASKLADFMIDFLAGGSPAPARDASGDMGAFVSDPAARRAQQLARLEARQQEKAAQKALERMDDDMKAGKALSAVDIQNLTRAQQETIRAHGDDALRQMVEDARKRAEKEWRGDGRERE